MMIKDCSPMERERERSREIERDLVLYLQKVEISYLEYLILLNTNPIQLGYAIDTLSTDNQSVYQYMQNFYIEYKC
jgi:hypothetical protein